MDSFTVMVQDSDDYTILPEDLNRLRYYKKKNSQQEAPLDPQNQASVRFQKSSQRQRHVTGSESDKTFEKGSTTTRTSTSTVSGSSTKHKSNKLDSIWSVPEEPLVTPVRREKKSSTSFFGKNKSTSSKSSDKDNSTPSSQSKLISKNTKGTELLSPGQLLENNWSLPRVELWCRDPDCPYNVRLWGGTVSKSTTNPTTNPHLITTATCHQSSSTMTAGQYIKPQTKPKPSSTTSNNNMSLAITKDTLADLPTPDSVILTITPPVTSTESASSTSSGVNTNSSSVRSTNTATNSNQDNSSDSGHQDQSTPTPPPMANLISSASSTTSTNLQQHPTKLIWGRSNTGHYGCTPHYAQNNLHHQPPPATFASMAYNGGNGLTALKPTNALCPSCNGIIPITPGPVVPSFANGVGLPADMSTFTNGDNGMWNFQNFHHPLQRDTSFHSFGGFTLNGQGDSALPKKHKVVKFCSSHKIALVVSTFSLLVTIGLVITLILMKKKGMMETMDNSSS